MKIEELKEAHCVLTRVLECHRSIDCTVACGVCPNNYFDEDEDRALYTAITVIRDIINRMERMQKADNVISNT